MNRNDKIYIMRRLALEAGEKILEIYNQDTLHVKEKDDKSPVTIADELADKHISHGLRLAFPDEIIVTEEQAHSHTLRARDFFIVDPLDGTKEFIHKRGDFTVNIAYVVNGVPHLGVVYAPAKKRLFYTTDENTSVEEILPHTLDKIGKQKKIQTSLPDMNALTIVASKSHSDQSTADYIEHYKVTNHRSAGSSLKFCLVATGEADLYPRLGRTMEWDTAAGHAILRGAGGDVVRFDNHEPLFYGKSAYENPYFIAHARGIKLYKED